MNDDSQKVFLCFFSEKQDKYLRSRGSAPSPPLEGLGLRQEPTRCVGFGRRRELRSLAFALEVLDLVEPGGFGAT